MPRTSRAVSKYTAAIFAAASVTLAAGTTEATVILTAIAGLENNTLTSNDPNYNLNSIVLQGATLTRGSGAVGFAAGTGVLKGDGTVGSSSTGQANIEGSASAQVSDVIFRHSDGADCQPVCQPLFPVTIAAQFIGSFSQVGSTDPGRARAVAQLIVNRGGQTVGFDNSFADSAVDGLGSFADTLATTFNVETGVPYSLVMILEMSWLAGQNGFTGAHSAITADFGKTFELDPAQVFQLPEGVLVNSESAGIVNNQIPHLLSANGGGTAVSEPPAFSVLALGLAGFGWMRRKGRRFLVRRKGSFSHQSLRADRRGLAVA